MWVMQVSRITIKMSVGTLTFILADITEFYLNYFTA